MKGILSYLFVFFVFTLVYAPSESLADSLLRVRPQFLPAYSGFNRRPSTCSNLKEPTKNLLSRLQSQGHKVAVILNNDTPFALPSLRIKDVFQNVKYRQINSLVEALEDRVKESVRWSESGDYQSHVRDCLRGRRLDAKGHELFPGGCVERLNINYIHSGFVIFNPRVSPEPYVIHLYGEQNESNRRVKASIRVESLDSYLRERRMRLCQLKIITLSNSVQNKLVRFFDQGHPRKLVLPGNSTYNMLSHPWGLSTQNCNEWTSEVLASSTYLNRSRWSGLSRRLAKETLADTGFTPIKVPLETIHTLLRVPSYFINGLGVEEGNIIHHPYGVADISPALVIEEWLKANGLVRNEYLLRGVL